MSKLIIDSSQMQCTLGTKPSKITVTSQSFVKLKDKLIATEKDNQTNSNIPSFGNCKRSSRKPACIPMPTNWEQTTQKDSINEMKKLTIDSTCKCSQGGIISFIDTSDNSFLHSK